MPLLYPDHMTLKRLLTLFILLFLSEAYAKTYSHSAISYDGIKVTTLCEKVLRPAYKKIGHQFIVTILPAARAIKYAAQGKHDGEICRFINESTPGIKENFFVIPLPFDTRLHLVFKVKSSLEKLRDLSGKRLVLTRGATSNHLIKALLKQKNIVPHKIEYIRLGGVLTFIRSNRADAAILPLSATEQFLTKDLNTFEVKGLRSLQLSHLIHKKNRELYLQLKKYFSEN